MKPKATVRAFTRSELLALITTISICVMISFRAGGSDLGSSRATVCMNNLKQLTTAWLMYAGDNNNRLVENYQGGSAQGGTAGNQGKAPWACGWLDWTTSPDNTNASFLLLQKYARLAPYYHATNIHKCPEDIFLSPPQQKRGFNARMRSVVLNAALGDGNFLSGPADPIYLQIKDLSQLLNPTPSETFAFLDEHPSSINDPVLLPPAQRSWVDMPGSYHENGGTFSFADGHTELHKWRATAQSSNVRITMIDGGFHMTTTPRIGDADISWLSFHAPRKSAAHY